MSTIKQRAREVVGLSWADYWMERGRPDVAHDFGAFSRAEAWALQRFPAALTPAEGDMGNPISVPDGFVLVPVESVKRCACGCERYCCTHCGTELGGLAARPEVKP